jgi:hypothetical protein
MCVFQQPARCLELMTMEFPDLLPDASQWRALTVSSQKHALFEQDLYFREAWAECIAELGNNAPDALASIALLCAKPDAVVGRRLQPMLEYAIEHGFALIDIAEFALTRHSMRDIWRYDWQVYTTDRLSFSTVWYTALPTLMFVLEDRAPEAGVPASVRLASLKGHALAGKRNPGDMRTRLAPPNTVLNFVHVPDEPADIVREIGILLGHPQRIAILRSICALRDSNASVEALQAIESLNVRYSAHDLDAAASLRRLQAAGMVFAPQRIEMCIGSGGFLSWHDLVASFSPDVLDTHRWDFIAVASTLIPRDRPFEGLVRNPDIHDWRRRFAISAAMP